MLNDVRSPAALADVGIKAVDCCHGLVTLVMPKPIEAVISDVFHWSFLTGLGVHRSWWGPSGCVSVQERHEGHVC